MTTIVAIGSEKTKTVKMACESYVHVDSRVIETNTPKIVSIGEILIGVAGDIHTINALHNIKELDSKEEDMDLDDYVYRIIIPAIVTAIDNLPALVSQSIERDFDLLLGVEGVIYRITESLDYFSIPDKTHATIGTGRVMCESAIEGILNFSTHKIDRLSDKLLESGMRVAISQDKYSGGKVTITTI